MGKKQNRARGKWENWTRKSQYVSIEKMILFFVLGFLLKKQIPS